MRISYKERLIIEQEVSVGRGVREIARLLGRNHSVISRELEPDKDQGQLPYSAKRAQLRSERRARITNKRKLDKNQFLRDFVVEKLSLDWSPEQIVGRLKINPPKKLAGTSLVPETIYQFVYSLERGEDGKLLYHHLRRSQPKRIRHYARKQSKLRIPERVSIHKRPTLTGLGHWETDSIICKGRQVLSVQFEKVTKLVRIHKLANHGAEETRLAIQDTLETLPSELKQTMTFDNGTENYQHNQLSIKTYFCDPYCAYQKGGVENTNGLIRQYFKKKTDLNQITGKQIHDIQERINNRPRKSLNYQTPNEILRQVVR
jgi:IS30 family transposase